MIHVPLHRFAEFGQLSLQEAQAVEALGEQPRQFARGDTIQQEHDTVQSFYILISGWVAASMSLRDGSRQVLKLHLPGDALGTPSMCLTNAAETLTAITPATVTTIPLKRFGELFVTNPRLSARFLLNVQKERVALMDRLLSIGQTSARSRIAAFLLDVEQRLEVLGLVKDNRFDLPITQEQLGNVVGLTAVHVNRTLQALKADNLLIWSGGCLTLTNRAALVREAQLPRRTYSVNADWLPKA